MSKTFAFLFPGQGAQYPGMGKDFYDACATARGVFEEADHCLNAHFSQLIFEGPASELTLTKNSQVAIYITSIAILRTVQENFPDIQPTVCAGLSLGEYTALTATARLSFADGLNLVRLRATFMHEACLAAKGEMYVVLGLDPGAITAVLQDLNTQAWVANINCPGQVVIAGTPEGMQRATQALKEHGAKRILPLDVSGAFHSPLMRSAQEKLEPEIRSVTLTDSSTHLVMNVPGDYVSHPDAIREHLITQVTHPVLWEKGIRAMEAQHIDTYIEMGPGKTLAGMNKRIGISQPTFSIEKIGDLETFQGVLCTS